MQAICGATVSVVSVLQACDAARPECSSCVLRGRDCMYASFIGPVRKRQQKVLELESQLKDQLQVGSDSPSFASSSECSLGV